MITRRKLKELFQNIAANHKQINSFGWGDVPEILGRQDHIYPLMMVTPAEVVMEQGRVRHNYVISVADRLKKDLSNQVDVDNDTELIMNDIISILYNIDYLELDVEIPLTITPFKNIDPQDVLGWFGTFSLIVDENYDYCAVPTEPIPFDPDPTPCPSAFYRVEYEDGQLIEEGFIASGDSKTIVVPDPGVCDDGVVNIVNSLNQLMYSVDVASGGLETQTIQNTTVQLQDSDGGNIGAPNSYLAESSNNLTAPDGVLVLKDTDNTTLRSVNVKSNETKNEVIADTTIQLKDSANNNIGSPQTFLAESSNSITAPDGIIDIQKSDNSSIITLNVISNQTTSYNVADSVVANSDSSYLVNVKATEGLNIPDVDIDVNGNKEGEIVSVKKVEIITSPAPTSVSLVGNVLDMVFPSGVPAPSANPELADFLTTTGITDTTIISALSNFIIDCKTQNYWNKITHFLPYVGGSSGNHAVCLKTAASIVTWFGGMTHNADGITGNGSNAYGEISLAPNAFPEDDLAFGIYVKSGTAQNGYDFSSGSGVTLISFWSDSRMYGAVNSAFSSVVNSGGIEGHYMCVRNNLLNATMFKNATATTAQQNSSAPGSGNFNIMRQSSFYADKNHQSLVIANGRWTRQEVDDFGDLVVDLQIALGR